MSTRKKKKIMNYKFKTKPYAHQLTALEKSWNKENFAYFMEMGTGKTKVLIDNMAMLYDKGAINGALIVAPKGTVKDAIFGFTPISCVTVFNVTGIVALDDDVEKANNITGLNLL